MAMLKSSEMAKMSRKEISEKLKELRVEMIRARVALKKGGKSNLREMKKTIARLLTSLKLNRLKGAAIKNSK